MDASLSSSPEAMNTPPDPNCRTEAAKNSHFTIGQTTLDTWLSAAVICLMTATMLALFWFPLRRTFANVEVNYNEGWNAYRAAMVASGIPLYGSPH